MNEERNTRQNITTKSSCNYWGTNIRQSKLLRQKAFLELKRFHSSKITNLLAGTVKNILGER